VKNQEFLEQVSSLLNPADDILVVTLFFLITPTRIKICRWKRW